MAKKQTKADDATREMFSKGELFDDSLQKELEAQKNQPVECLGMTFPNDDARREYFLDKLREKLQEPEFRKTPGFPKGDDEAILRMSDPPYYTACPNPFLGDFIKTYGKPYDPKKKYHRDPFAVDTSAGKTDALYRAHAYHTKVPHLAIVPSLLHYTEPGDVVLDGFAGTGMTGVASQFCASPPSQYKQSLEQAWSTAGHSPPKWGRRSVLLNDLGPAASFIAAGYNLSFSNRKFFQAAKAILKQVADSHGWMYETLHSDGTTVGRIDYTVWSEVFTCPDCSEEVHFFEEAVDPETKEIADTISCPSCGAENNKESMDLRFESVIDPMTGDTRQRPLRRPALIQYRVGKTKYEKKPDTRDLDVLSRVQALSVPASLPLIALPECQMTRVGRMATTRTQAVHHLFLDRAAVSMSALWDLAAEEKDPALRRQLLWFVEQAVWGISLLNRYKPIQHGRPGGSQVNNYMTGFFYVASTVAESSPHYILEGKLKRLAKVFEQYRPESSTCGIQTGTCDDLPIPDSCVDYVFTDPPFGENIYYADLNFVVESWHGVYSRHSAEAIVDRSRDKSQADYQDLMRKCFSEYNRVLKPGRWITIVFSSSKNAIWHAIQEALGAAGLVVADVRTLDKKQGSFKQVTSTAVKQDLVISAYKPTDALLKRFELGYSTPDAAWSFIREHLTNVPVCVKQGGSLQVLAERTPQMLLDRMIAFHVQRGMGVPLDAGEFLAGLAERFAERDGMYFLTEQVASRRRSSGSGVSSGRSRRRSRTSSRIS